MEQNSPLVNTCTKIPIIICVTRCTAEGVRRSLPTTTVKNTAPILRGSVVAPCIFVTHYYDRFVFGGEGLCGKPLLRRLTSGSVSMVFNLSRIFYFFRRHQKPLFFFFPSLRSPSGSPIARSTATAPPTSQLVFIETIFNLKAGPPSKNQREDKPLEDVLKSLRSGFTYDITSVVIKHAFITEVCM